ncbi:long-chain-fatty-acid--CoA ligase [Virgibacillus sediminis]|uniref:Long-chain fatty acid--CoA ligase n=1 Tax=Virgibacillus sediminis TaxID=202260 RepID=A0ABV7A9Z9_9BACI
MQNLKERRWYKAYPEAMKKELRIPEVSVYSLLEETTVRCPHRQAVIQDGDSLTYQELKEQADRLAGAWKRLGLARGERIGLMVSNDPSYIIAYYAAMKLGMVVVQINPRYTARELLQIASDAEVAAITVEENTAETVRQLEGLYEFKHIFIAGSPHRTEASLESLIAQSKPLEKEAPVTPKEDTAVIQYTGGTSGVIKGAKLSHYNLVANVIQSYAMYGEDMEFGKETVLTATPLYHVYAMTSGMNLGIYIGATNLLIKKFAVDDVLEKIKEYQPTFFPGVPRMYNAFINHSKVREYGLDCLKFCSSGSAPLPMEVIRQFESITGAVIGEGFGLSEASPSTHRNPPKGIRKVGSIGIPLPGTDSKIVDEDSKELPANSVGELVIKGPQIMKGYWNNEEETRKSLKNGWLYTGDLAIQDEDGYFFIAGRKKEMIINGGFNVYPQEVENVLYEHPDIQECAVAGIPDPQQGEVVKAYIVAKQGASIDLEELKGFCYRSLTPYKVPKQFEVMETLPRNTVGKILKRKLVEAEEGRDQKEEI